MHDAPERDTPRAKLVDTRPWAEAARTGASAYVGGVVPGGPNAADHYIPAVPEIRLGPMHRSAALVLLLFALPAGWTAAQVVPVYGVLPRPPGVRYEVLRSRHFDVIRQTGTDAEAVELAARLEEALSDGPTLFPVPDGFRMPVVLSRYTDRGNGYVSPVPFRQEIDVVPFSGLSVSPRHTTWLDTVAPHELVHALHAEVRAGFGIGGIVRPFAPDMARAMNLWVPSGIAEGAAIHVESLRGTGVGRLHYGYTLMQYRAAAGSEDPWSLAQALERPKFTRPTDRHYVGGGPFVDWFLGRYGADRFRRVSRVHNRFPFLGYGLSLWIGSGRAPWSLGREFRRHATESERAFRSSEPLADSPAPLSGRKGMVHRRPRWLDDGTLVVFMTAYDRERGLFTVDTGTGRLQALAHEELSSDLGMSVASEEPRLSYARYVVDPLYPVRRVADLFTTDTRSGATRRLTRGAHLLYPVRRADGGTLAVESIGRGGAIVAVAPDGRVTRLFSDPDLRVVGLDVSERSGRVLVVANRYGVQGLWELDLRSGLEPSLEFLLGFRNGSVLDASWTPDGEGIVFSADVDAKLDVWWVDPGEGRTVRMTHSVYGAMEPAVSPDGTRLAYVRYGPERFDLVVDSFDPSLGTAAEPTALVGAGDLPGAPRMPPPDSIWTDPVAHPYRAARHLGPRMVYPVFYVDPDRADAPNADLGFGGGVALQGADPLLRWSWWGEGFYRKDRLWGEFGLATAALVTRPTLWLYDRPETVNVLLSDGQSSLVRRVVREERGASLAMRLPVTLSDNVRSSSMAVGAALGYEEQRLLDDSMNPITDFTGRLTAAGSIGFGVGVQRNLRDLVPNRGLFLTLLGKSDLAAVDVKRRESGVGAVALYLPWLSRLNVGIRLDATWVGQSELSILDLDWFMPRGQEDRLPEWRSMVRFGAETVVPLAFVDDGLLILPVFVSAIYLYGFGETVMDAGQLGSMSDIRSAERLTSVGCGLGVRARLFHILDLDLRLGAARRVNDGDWTLIYR